MAYFYVLRRGGLDGIDNAINAGSVATEMGVEEKLPTGVLLTTLENLFGYMRSASFWPATFGLACCAIEMMTYGAPRYDSGRWGQEVFRASPRQADLMIVAGRVSQKMAPVLRQIYDQMPNPKWVLAMGVCASTGGMFNNYAIVQGVDHVVPVDMYLPGCPPRPEMLIDAMFKLREKVRNTPIGLNAIEAATRSRAAAAGGTGAARAEGPAAVTTTGPSLPSLSIRVLSLSKAARSPIAKAPIKGAEPAGRSPSRTPGHQGRRQLDRRGPPGESASRRPSADGRASDETEAER